MSNHFTPVYHSGISTGTQLAAGTASTASLLPVDSNGSTPRACLFVANNSSGAHIRLGTTTASTTATSGDLFIGQVPVALITRGMSAFAALRDTSTAAVNISAVPLEDG